MPAAETPDVAPTEASDMSSAKSADMAASSPDMSSASAAASSTSAAASSAKRHGIMGERNRDKRDTRHQRDDNLA